MRCRRAQRWMVAAVDGELAPRRRRMLEDHVGSCPACRRDLAGTGEVLERVAGLAAQCEVPSRLEQATLRRIRLLAAADEERSAARGWWAGLRAPALALATAAVAIVAVALTRGTGDPPTGPSPAPDQHPGAGQAPARGKPPLIASSERRGPQGARHPPPQ